MSDKVVPILSVLLEEQEAEAKRSSRKFQAPASSDSNTQSSQKQSSSAVEQPQRPKDIFSKSGRNIFQNTDKSLNLFQVSTLRQANHINIFDTAAKPLIVLSEQHEEAEEECSQNPKHKELKSEAEMKITQYTYNRELEKIHQFKLKKFKEENKPVKEGIYVTLEKTDMQRDRLYLIIRGQEVKISLYSAFLMKSCLKMEHFIGKTENLKMHALKPKEKTEGESRCGIQKQCIKLQFLSSEDCSAFQEAVSKFFEG